jgi:hypothetical protein
MLIAEALPFAVGVFLVPNALLLQTVRSAKVVVPTGLALVCFVR